MGWGWWQRGCVSMLWVLGKKMPAWKGKGLLCRGCRARLALGRLPQGSRRWQLHGVGGRGGSTGNFSCLKLPSDPSHFGRFLNPWVLGLSWGSLTPESVLSVSVMGILIKRSELENSARGPSMVMVVNKAGLTFSVHLIMIRGATRF